MIRCDMKTADAYVNDVYENRVEEKRASTRSGSGGFLPSPGSIPFGGIYKCPSVLPETFGTQQFDENRFGRGCFRQFTVRRSFSNRSHGTGRTRCPRDPRTDSRGRSPVELVNAHAVLARAAQAGETAASRPGNRAQQK